MRISDWSSDVCSSDLQLIWSEPRGEAAGYRWPQVSLHRGKLQMLLLAAAQARIGRENLLTGRALADWRGEERRGEGAGIVAAFADKRSGQRGRYESGSLRSGGDGARGKATRRER